MRYSNRHALTSKTALVLSAGGMFGAYQAGAWRVLAKTFRPDLVIGASAGSINAWIIAGGADPEALVGHWLDPAVSGLTRIHPFRRPRTGIFDPAPLYAHVEALWNAYRPQMDITVVAVDLKTLRPKLFRNEEITWRHLAASCAIPVLYPPVRIGGRLYTDGGLLGTMPLLAAAESGAGRILGVNALPRLPSRIANTATQAFRAWAPRLPALPEGPEIHVIAPQGHLGSLREALFWNGAAAKRFIAAGEQDAGEAARRGWASP
jgi:predicted acylesterase/phospholipase RssA